MEISFGVSSLWDWTIEVGKVSSYSTPTVVLGSYPVGFGSLCVSPVGYESYFTCVWNEANQRLDMSFDGGDSPNFTELMQATQSSPLSLSFKTDDINTIEFV